MIEILKHNPEYQDLEQGWEKTGLYFKTLEKAKEYARKQPGSDWASWLIDYAEVEEPDMFAEVIE